MPVNAGESDGVRDSWTMVCFILSVNRFQQALSLENPDLYCRETSISGWMFKENDTYVNKYIYIYMYIYIYSLYTV